jgi:DNA-binding NarL/FixJ family response regulator
MKTRIMIADDHRIVRDGIRALLEREPSVVVVGVAEDGREVLERVTALAPDLLLMDIAMPGLNGIETTRQLTRDHPKVKVVALSTHSDRRYVAAMLGAGAAGYLLKDCAYEELVLAIQAVQRGHSYFSPEVAQIVLSDYRKSDLRAMQSPLSAREREVLQLVVEGHTMRKIGDRLCIGIKTVETHRKQIATKLGISTLADLVKYAIREGITEVEP